MEIINTVCTVCEANCGLIVHIQDGKLIKTEGNPSHPISRGYICPKGRALPDMLSETDRLRHPLKKQADNSWQEISWDEALDTIAENLRGLQNKGTPHHLAVHIGQAGVNKQFTDYVERFCSIFGTPNLSTSDSYCHTSRAMANTLTFGYRPTPDYENSSCIVLWGYNPTHSSPPISNAITRARHRGAKLIVIDPYSSDLAINADLHLQVRPGTDLAFALGILSYVVQNELYDKDFVENWTIGFSDLQNIVKPYTPENVEKITGVPADKLVEAVQLYAGSASACLEHGMALELQTNGFQTIRAIAILQAITGNLDIIGGALATEDFRLESISVPSDKEIEAIGQNEFPLFHKFTNHSQSNMYFKAILESKPYPVESMIVVGSNPLLAWPYANKVRRALENINFLIVVDNFMTASAQLADIVLPAATFLSQNELWAASGESGELVVGLAPKGFEEDGCLSDLQVWNQLAKKMGYDNFFSWEDDEVALNDRLEPLGLSIDQLKQLPNGYVYGSRSYKKYLRNGFATESGKAEIYSSILKQYVYDPLPIFRKEFEGNTNDFPLTLSFGTRSIGYRQSKSGKDKSGKKKPLVPLLEIHPDKAGELGLAEGDLVIVESSLSSIEITIAFNNEIEPEVVFIPHGWDEANANTLTGDRNLDPITGFPVDRCLAVRVIKK